MRFLDTCSRMLPYVVPFMIVAALVLRIPVVSEFTHTWFGGTVSLVLFIGAELTLIDVFRLGDGEEPQFVLAVFYRRSTMRQPLLLPPRRFRDLPRNTFRD